jgi:2'-5' RNA ligase
MHITTHFVGDVTQRSARAIVRAFALSPLPPASEIVLGGKPKVGVFGKDVLYLRVTDPASLLHALRKEGRRIAPVKVTYPTYTPHVTLARNPKRVDWSAFVRAMNAHPFVVAFTPTEAVLIHSYDLKGEKHHDIIARRRLPKGKKPSKRGEH